MQITLPTDLFDLNSPVGVVLRILLFAAVTIIAAQLIETLLERYFRQAST